MTSMKDTWKELEKELPQRKIQTLKENTKGMKAAEKRKFLEEKLEEYRKSKVEPGEPVGLLAAQAVGERATQMVLRTFHIAGLTGELSVPQGMPRLKELLEVRHQPKMETCKIQIKKELNGNKEKVKEIARDMEEVTLEEVADVQEDFNEKRIIINFNEKKMKKQNLKPEEVAAKIKDKLRKKPEKVEDDQAIFKPKASTLKSLRRYTQKAKTARVKGIKGIKRATIVERKQGNKKTYEIHTDGTNLRNILKLPEVNSKETYSNSIREVQGVLGIEAARKVLHLEIQENLKAQNITINDRHIMLISDAMTRKGELNAIGRHGISGEKESVLANASFETQMRHLLTAAQKGETDPLKGVAERMIVGEVIPVGTGSVELRMSNQKQKKK